MIDPNDLFLPKKAIRSENRIFLWGRKQFLEKAIEAISVSGASMVLYGHRGVGKTSIAWQVMSVLSGDKKTSDDLDLKPAIPVKPTNCVWLQCSRVMRDLEDVIVDLIGKHASDPCLRSYYPKVFTGALNESIESLVTRNFAKENRSAQSVARGSKGWPGEVRRVFEQVLLQVRKLYDVQDLVVFIDEFDTVASARGMGDLIKTSDLVRFVVVGVSDTVADLIDDHQSVSRKLAGSTFNVPPLSEKELNRIFDRAESRVPAQLVLSPEFREPIIRDSEGLPWFVHLVGFLSIVEANRELLNGRRTLPFKMGQEDYQRAIDVLLKPGVDDSFEPDDPYRIDRICSAVGRSSIREAILYEFVDHPEMSDDALRDLFEKNEVELTTFAIRNALNLLTKQRVLQRRQPEDGQRATYRFADPILRHFVKMAKDTKGEGGLTGKPQGKGS